MAQPRFLVRAPALTQIERADEQVAAAFEQQMRRQLQRLAVILRRHQLLAGDGFHQFQSCVVHGSGSFGEVSIFRSEEHTSELQSLMRISYSVFCLKIKTIHFTEAWI